MWPTRRPAGNPSGWACRGGVYQGSCSPGSTSPRLVPAPNGPTPPLYSAKSLDRLRSSWLVEESPTPAPFTGAGVTVEALVDKPAGQSHGPETDRAGTYHWVNSPDPPAQRKLPCRPRWVQSVRCTSPGPRQYGAGLVRGSRRLTQASRQA